MPDNLIKHNATHILAVVNASGSVPEEGTDYPSVHLSTDANGNLLVAGVGGATANVAITNGPGAAAVNIQDGGNSITVDGTVSVTGFANPLPVTDNGGSLTVDGPLTDTQLRATPVPVSGTITTTADPRQQFTQFGELQVAQRSPQAAWRFNYGLIDKLFTKTETNGGTVTVSGDNAILSTGTNPAGLARVETIKRIRYLNGFGGFWLGVGVFSAGAANSRQIMGIGDVTDRLFVGRWGTDFVCGRRRAGVDSVGFRQTITPTWTPSFGNIYGITFGWLGHQGAVFARYNEVTRVITPIYYFDYANSSADVYILNPTLPIFAEVANDGNTTDIVMKTPSAMGGSQGYPGDEVHSPLNVYRPFDVTATYADANNNKILSIQNKASAFAGPVANRVPVAIRSIDMSRSSSGAATSTVRLYKTVTTSADPLVFTDVDTNNSPVATNIVAATILTGTSEWTYTISSVQTGRVAAYDNGQLLLYPGETLTIAIQGSGVQSTTYSVTVNWEEQF